jgi:2-polyprenyl-6-methoxyphenol hydroxylase-like FAD-dependent oxidoreductase
MDFDVVTIGGGLGGSTLASAVARSGRRVLVLEREKQFKDRVRGENMLPWGVAAARRLGVVNDLLAAGGRQVPFFNSYFMGTQTEHRPFPTTTPTGEASLNMYHPDLQETLLRRAVNAGAEVVRGTAVQSFAEVGGGWKVTFGEDAATRSITARLVVGADGRFSAMRQVGGFTVRRDPENLRIAGTLVEGTKVPDDGVHLCLGPGFATFIAPLGNGRARVYFIYVGALGDRKLSGNTKGGKFIDACRATNVPSAWFDGVSVVGPLAEFEGADHWVSSPGKSGLALIGDAAGATDPSWGCGLSKTLVDVETLATQLAASDDWNVALQRYAAMHDDYFGKLHNILSWWTTLVWSGGPEADARRARVFPRMHQDRTGFPDPAGQGPFGPCDERARRMLLGEDLSAA